MRDDEKDYLIDLIENFYTTRIPELIDESRYGDVDSIFKEFVVNGEEPNEWLFLDFIVDVC